MGGSASNGDGSPGTTTTAGGDGGSTGGSVGNHDNIATPQSGVTHSGIDGGDGATFDTGTPGAAITRLATSGSYGTADTTDPHHIPLPTVNSSTSIDRQGALGYAVQTQPSLDNNSVDLDRERANFVDNAVRYEATLRFINGNAKTMLSAIQGQ